MSSAPASVRRTVVRTARIVAAAVALVVLVLLLSYGAGPVLSPIVAAGAYFATAVPLLRGARVLLGGSARRRPARRR